MSENAKDFISKLLVMDPAKRMSAKDALKHVWLKSVIANDAMKAKQGLVDAFSNLSKFNSDSNLKKATFSFISQQLVSKQERDDFLQVFNTLDKDHSGNLTKQEFIAGHKEFFGDGLTEAEVMELYNRADLD